MRVKYDLMYVLLVVVLGAVLFIPTQSALAQAPPSSRYTGVTSTVCDGTGYPIELAIQNNILAGQSTITTFYVAGVLQPSGTFTENGPITSANPSYNVGPNEAFSYAAGTIFASQVDSYDGPGGTGERKYSSRIEWVCDTGVVVSLTNTAYEGGTEEAEAVPGCDVLIPIPSTAVGGTFVVNAPLYWMPGQLTSPLITIPSGHSARVIGLDASGQYYKILWACSFVWVQANTIGPNYDNVWHGAPLPVSVVN